jgi:hypothetical protein
MSPAAEIICIKSGDWSAVRKTLDGAPWDDAYQDPFSAEDVEKKADSGKFYQVLFADQRMSNVWPQQRRRNNAHCLGPGNAQKVVLMKTAATGGCERQPTKDDARVAEHTAYFAVCHDNRLRRAPGQDISALLSWLIIGHQGH